MIVCHCTGLSDREIRTRAAAPGFRPEDILGDLEAGWTCGGCAELVRKIVAEVPAPAGRHHRGAHGAVGPARS